MPDDSKRPVIPTTSRPAVWHRLKPLVRQMRHEPTPAENRLWQAIRDRQIAGAKFRRQHRIGPYIVDFYCADANLIVEVDGVIHEHTAAQDADRQENLESLGLRVVRVTNEEVFATLGDVLEVIREALSVDDAS